MLFEIERRGSEYGVLPDGLAPAAPSNLGLLEKHIEQWLADHPEILLPGEQVLVIAQSVSGQSMADILALDAAGRLIIIEIKRDWSSRETVGQLLEYAARLSPCSYEYLEGLARKYFNNSALELFATFQEAFPDSPAGREDLGKSQRILVVAPEADESLRSIVTWLTKYRVPIQFVPFSVYADSKNVPRFLAFDGITPVSEEKDASTEGWAGHWIFNTNESNASGAFEKMFERDVAAIFGYPNGPQNLEGSRQGDFVLAYVNQQGLRAVGRVLDGHVREGQGIFLDEEGRQHPSEYHLAVHWEAVLDRTHAISSREAKATFGYNLPVRSVFGKMHQGGRAALIEKELRKRAIAAPAD